MNISKTKSFSKNLSDIKVFFRIERILSKTFLKKKTIRAQNVHAQLHYFSLFYNSNWIITNKLKKLQFLPVSEMGKFHTLVLNSKDWPFGVILTRHFRTKLGYLNERVYCKLIDRTSKMLFIKESGSFLRPTSPELWKLLGFG